MASYTVDIHLYTTDEKITVTIHNREKANFVLKTYNGGKSNLSLLVLNDKNNVIATAKLGADCREHICASY